MRVAKALKEKDERFKYSCGLDQVKAANNPNAAAMTLYLQDLEHSFMCEVATTVVSVGATIASYAFDGIYILATDEDHLRDVYRGVAWSTFTSAGIMLALKNPAGEVIDKLDFQASKKRSASHMDKGSVAEDAKSQRAS